VPAAIAVLNQHQPSDGATRTKNRLICPATLARRTGRTVAGLPPAAMAGARPRLSTVHQAKGDEAEAVLLLMKGPTTVGTLTAWLAGTVPNAEVAEALRVVYVAVTRARRLLGIAVPAADRERVVTHLHRVGVPTELR